MRILFYYFLPALIPLLLYCISYYYEVHNAKKLHHHKPKFFGKKLYDSFIVSLILGVLIFIILYFFMEMRQKDDSYKGYKVIDGQIVR